jgi:hypothetical protein
MKFQKKPVTVEAWRLIDPLDSSCAPMPWDFCYEEAELYGIKLRIVDAPLSPVIELWCEKSKQWVFCPPGTYVVREQDGIGFYPYHKGFMDAHEVVYDGVTSNG